MNGIFGSGTRDFLIIRITSLVLLCYFLFLFIYIASNSPITFVLWSALFTSFQMKIFTSLFLISFAVHTWLGTWAIGTDYLTYARLGSLGQQANMIYRVICAGIIGCVLFWSFFIIW